MDSVKKERQLLRSSVTKGSNKIQEILSKAAINDQDKIDLQSQWDVVCSRFQDLEAKDGEIRALLISDANTEDEALEQEQEKVDEYAHNFYKTKINVDKVLSEDVARSEHSSSRDLDVRSSGSGVTVSNATKVKCNLPKLKLREFGGDLNEWLPFWSQFEKIDQDSSLSPSDKLGYLTMCMQLGSPARELVESYPASAAIYPEVVSALKDRFGRSDLLTEFYIRELLKIILHNVKSKMDIRTLYDKLQCHLRNLETLGVTSENCASILMPLVSSCLPEDILLVWERSSVHLPNPTSKDYLNNLLSFLKAEVEGSQKMEMARSGFGLSETPKNAIRRKEFKQNSFPEGVPTAAALVSTKESKSTSCIFCSELSHQSEDCSKAQRMSISDKKEVVLKKQACYCCLKIGHRATRCRKRPKCGKCGKSHFDLMCSDTGGLQNNLKGKTTQVLTSSCKTSVLLQTLVVKVKNETSNDWEYAKLLFDTGSQQSYVLETTVSTLGYRPTGTEVMQHALFGGGVTKPLVHNVYKIVLSNLDDTYECSFDVFGQDQICSPIPSVPSGSWIQELNQQNIHLSDLGHPSTEIEILVGVDVAGKLYTGRRMQLRCGLIAMETLLGWTLSGKIPQLDNIPQSHCVANVVTSLLIKEAAISDLWSLDVLGIKDPTEGTLQAEIDQNTQDHFLSTVKINNENRFEVNLPFVDSHPPLADNHSLSLKRLQSTVNRLKQNRYMKDYQEVLDVWLDQGVIEEVPEEEVPNAAHYLPHHAVIKIGSTTPVRPVFDASAKGSGGVSLNQCLAKGPNLIEKIPACLARFRKDKIGISGDIAKAFLQISVSPKDRDYLRFLWKTKDGELKVYRHCRVVFGVSCSPFLLESCLKLHLENVLKMCKEDKLDWSLPVLEMLTNSFYVDNCLVSVNDEDQAKEFIHMASTVMMERGFDLRGWEKTGDNHEKPTYVLGLLWNKSEDTLAINIDRLLSMEIDIVTKRVLLSAAHRLFDPVGIVSSVALIPKLLVQETWCQNLSWNEEVAEDTRDKFQQWLSEVPLLADVRIPRWIADNDLADAKYQVHVFSDACKSSYATCVFLRIEHKDGVTLRLLASRAKVAPVPKAGKEMTIPRLELLAASIATRLYHTVINDYKLADIQTIFWTDATTVLAWILRQEPWDVFVMNRIKEIRQLSKGSQWRHIPGEFNPADLPSRGCCAKKLLQCRWWEGPQWLREDQENWPQSTFRFDEKEIVQERKKTVVSSMVCKSQNSHSDWYYCYFSQFKKIVRMIAWMIRFTKNCQLEKEQRSFQNLSANEIIVAEHKVFVLIQTESFKDVSKLKHLVTFEENGLIRLRTKISNRDDNEDFCHPIVLPSEHPVVHRMIMHEHKNNCHAGGQILLSILRQRFWILGGRRTIRSVINTCVTCKRHSAKKMEVVPTPLPESRVRDTRVFEVTGVDLAGPLFIKGDNGVMKKIWICIFTCAVYRAVRLELVSSLSTDSFILALRRFCARQGRPSIIYSDNGTNFVGFDGVCAKLDWCTIADYSSARRIEWRFNPPASPWWGGWWERLISVMKGLLRRVLGKTSVNQEVLQTIVCDCESIINQRPLTYMSENPQELTPITPSMFLKDIEEVGMPEFDFYGSVELKKRVKYRQELAKSLRKRFRNEYLGQLQLFANQQSQRAIRHGEVVLIGDEHSKRIDWLLGRVVELIHGADGHVRVVKIRTSGGVLTRPIQRVYPLEMECSPDEITPVVDPGDVPHSDLNPEPSDDNVADVSDLNCEPVPDIPTGKHKLNNSVSEIEGPINQVTRRGRWIRKPSRFN